MFRALCLLSALVLAAPAGAATIKLYDGVHGTVTPLVSVNPGVYGVEVRGGTSGAAANGWELGVGTQTTKPNTPATYATGQISWPTTTAALAYTLSWSAGQVTMTIGTTTVSWNAAWQTGNAVTVSMKGSGTFLSITSIDGIAVNWMQTQGSGAASSFTFYGEALKDGWMMSGMVKMSHGNGRGVDITSAEYVPVPAALPLMALGLGALALAGRRRRRA